MSKVSEVAGKKKSTGYATLDMEPVNTREFHPIMNDRYMQVRADPILSSLPSACFIRHAW